MITFSSIKNWCYPSKTTKILNLPRNSSVFRINLQFNTVHWKLLNDSLTNWSDKLGKIRENLNGMVETLHASLHTRSFQE